jgi:hypothetical protein
MDNQKLRPEKALYWADRLHAIKGARQSRPAVEGTAEDLIRWCQGAEIDGHYYPPEEQVEWLVNEAREQWDDWQGPKALRALFCARFMPESRPELKRYEGYKPTPIACDHCHDTGALETGEGWVPCGYCEAGARVSPAYLDTLNRLRKPPTPKPRLVQSRGLTPSQEEIERIKREQERHRRGA